MSKDPTTYGTPECPHCHDRYLVTAQCSPATRAHGCVQDGHHEHHGCTKCMAEWTEPVDVRPNLGIFTAEQFDRITREVREHLRDSAEYAKRRKLN